MNKLTLIFLFIIFALLIMPEKTRADSNYYINKMKAVPVSQFDLYIYKLGEKLKCRNDRVSMTKSTKAKTPCLTDIEYDKAGNTLIMYFYVDSSNRDLRNFRGQNKKKKEKTMLNILKKLSVELGVEGQKVGDEIIRLGTIQLTPVTYTYTGDQFSGEQIEFYSEIADITEINLVTNIRSSVYKTTRQKSGSYFYQVDKSGK